MEFNEGPTAVDGEVVDESDTGKHNSLAYLGGREAGFTEGVNAVLVALARDLRQCVPGISDTEVKKLLDRIRKDAEKRG